MDTLRTKIQLCWFSHRLTDGFRAAANGRLEGGVLQTGKYVGHTNTRLIELRIERNASGFIKFSGDVTDAQLPPAYFFGSVWDPRGLLAPISAPVQILHASRWWNGSASLSFDPETHLCELAIGISSQPFLHGVCRFVDSTLRNISVFVFAEERLANDWSMQSSYWPRIADIEIARASYAKSGVTIKFYHGGAVRHPSRAPDVWTTAELNMVVRDLAVSQNIANYPNSNYILLNVGSHKSQDLIGLMFDESDEIPRQGCALFMKHPYLKAQNELERENRNCWGIVHELGHCLNLLHTFDPGSIDANRDYSLSWMNYPYRYDGLPGNRDGDYFRRFNRLFQNHESSYLRHGSNQDILAGGSFFGGANNAFSLSAAASPFAEGVREQGDPIELSPIPNHALGSPVYLEYKLPVELDAIGATVTSGDIAVYVEDGGGNVKRYCPTATECRLLPAVVAVRVQTAKRQYIGFGRGQHYFVEPGEYRVFLVGSAPTGRVFVSNAQTFRVTPPVVGNTELDFLFSPAVQQTFEFDDASGVTSLSDFTQRTNQLGCASARMRLSAIVGRTWQQPRRRLDVKNERVVVYPPNLEFSITTLNKALTYGASDPSSFGVDITRCLAAQARNMRKIGERDLASALLAYGQKIKLASSDESRETIFKACSLAEPFATELET
ncbi:MAG: hypothetical protein KC592_02800 [Nitrospira sp.]|nr:hypothetical protein [Nitrospira sp.]